MHHREGIVGTICGAVGGVIKLLTGINIQHEFWTTQLPQALIAAVLCAGAGAITTWFLSKILKKK